MKNIDQFIFVRHGETKWNATGLMQFQSDIPLNKKGRAQAKTAGQIMASHAKGGYYIACSPYDRAHQTPLFGII